MKKLWSKPVIEKVQFEFDKQMDTACYVSYPSSATPTSGACNICAAQACWSNASGTYSNGPCDKKP